MNYYPLLINIQDMPVTVIGGGEVARRKIVDLLELGAVVTVIAPEISDSIYEMHETYPPERLVIMKRPYAAGDLEMASLVFSAANDPAVNESVYREAASRKILINAVVDPTHCTFIVPSWFKRGDLIVSVSTGGASPSLAARVRRDIEKAIPRNVETVLESLKKARTLLMDHPGFAGFDSRKRGEILKRITGDDRFLEMMAAAENDEAVMDILMTAADKGSAR